MVTNGDKFRNRFATCNGSIYWHLNIMMLFMAE